MNINKKFYKKKKININKNFLFIFYYISIIFYSFQTF